MSEEDKHTTFGTFMVQYFAVTFAVRFHFNVAFRTKTFWIHSSSRNHSFSADITLTGKISKRQHVLARSTSYLKP